MNEFHRVRRNAPWYFHPIIYGYWVMDDFGNLVEAPSQPYGMTWVFADFRAYE